MNINELNRINPINVEAETDKARANSGTFKEILDKVYDGSIRPLINNSGEIIGISYDAGAATIVEDNIAERVFAKRYANLPVMEWTLAALKMRADGKVIAEVTESEEDGIYVTFESGEVEVIQESRKRRSYEDEDDESYEDDSAPDSVEIPYSELENPYSEKAIKAYLRDTYNRYLSGTATKQFDAEPDDEDEIVKITNIAWGRKK